MWNLPTKCLRRLWLRIYKLGIADVLALHRRNEVRSDGLVLKNLCTRLEICWDARGVHPWDEDLSPHAKRIAFAEQVLEDTEAAVTRILERLPEGGEPRSSRQNSATPPESIMTCGISELR